MSAGLEMDKCDDGGVWSYDTCQIKKVNPLRQGQGAPSCATLGWRKKVSWGHHLYYTYKEILNALKVKGHVKHIPLLMIFLTWSHVEEFCDPQGAPKCAYK